MSDERVSSKELETIRQRLSERDFAILRAVAQHQFMTTRQIMRLYFYDHRSELSGIRATIRVLSRLLDLRVLSRLERAVGGTRAGSSSFVWCLDVVGDRLSRSENGSSRRRFFQPSLTFLGHKLALAETRIVIEETVRRHKLELLALDVEMRAWRPFLGAGGQTIQLKPDLGAITATIDHEDHWLIEVDLGTESFRTLLEKSAVYEAYRRTGREQAARGVFPRVLWVMPTVARAASLRDHIANTRTLDTELFTVVTPDLLPATITGEIDPLSGQFRNSLSHPRSSDVVKTTTGPGGINRTGLPRPSELKSGGHARHGAGGAAVERPHRRADWKRKRPMEGER